MITLDDIRKRAYEIYLFRQENFMGGNATTDWYDAQNQLIREERLANLHSGTAKEP